LAAGGSTITSEFVTSLDVALLADGRAAVNLAANAVSFMDPVYADLSAGDEAAAAEDANKAAASEEKRGAFEITLLGWTIKLSTAQLVMLLALNMFCVFVVCVKSFCCKRVKENRQRHESKGSCDSLGSSLDSEML